MGPLLETKLYIPGRHPGLLSRPRLVERLNQGAQRKLTLVSAPAGSGKSTLVAEWVAASRRAAAWISLDPGDNNPALFWTYVVTALRTARPDVGESALSWLSSARPPATEWILTSLINEITANDQHVALILDDYHVIDAEPIHRAVAFLLEHLPPRMHLVIATRSDPPLPLARLRGRGELTELRASDLRFTPEEAAAFLNEAMGLGLSAADVAVLEARTEGWIVGLQLAALSMQGREDLPGFIRAFSGDDRYIVDYLVDEVLHRQPDRVRTFLLQTAVLDRLSAPLCDALTGRDDGRGMLQALERDNLFVVPLDDKRHWFRYHHLFADVLRARALAEQPRQVPVLHQQASAWFERHGLPSDAVRHALAAEDFGRAADLLERTGRAMLTTTQDAFLDWLKALPYEVIRARPVLSVYYALALLPGDLETAEARLRDAEGVLDQASARPEAAAVEMVIVDDEGFRSLPGSMAIVRAYLAGASGDVPETVHYARQALGLLPEGDALWRGAAGALLGLAHWTSGDLEEAYQAFAEGQASLRKTGDITLEMIGAFVLANIRTAQGRLRDAARLYEGALDQAARQGGPVPPTAADLYVGLSELCHEHNDLDAAARYLRSSQELGEHGGLQENRYRWYVGMARIAEAQGDLDRALELLDEAQRQYVRSPNPGAAVRPVAAVKARVWVRQGRLAEALGWAHERGLSVDDELSYLREFEHITLARLLHRPPPEQSGRERSPGSHGAARSSPAGGGTRQETGEPDRGPGAASTRASGTGRCHPCPRAPGARPDPGRTGGLRPDLCGRRSDDAHSARPRRRSWSRQRLRPAPAVRVRDARSARAHPASGRPSRARRAAHTPGGRDPASHRGGNAESGDRRAALHQPVHGQASRRQCLREAGRQPPHRSRGAGERAGPAVRGSRSSPAHAA